MISIDTVLDVEWIELIKEAKSIGIEKEEILAFLKKMSSQEKALQ